MHKSFTSFLFLFVLTLSVYTASAQHTLKLATETLQVPGRPFYIRQVLDARLVDNSVGVVQKGLLNKKVSAEFEQPLPQALQAFTDLHLPQQAGQYPVTMRVKRFWVTEFTSSSAESGTTDIALDFVYEQEGQHYLLYSTAKLNTYYGLDVTHKHEGSIAASLSQMLQEFAVRNLEAMLQNAPQLTTEQLHEKHTGEADGKSYPIMQASRYNSGVYLTLDEFRNNAPALTTGYELKQRSGFSKAMAGGGTFIPVVLDENGKERQIKGAWGYAEGQNLFINIGGSYIPIALLDGKFSFIGPPVDKGASAAVGAATAAGGLVGGVVAATIAATTAKPTLYTLNLETGAIELDGTPIGMNSEAATLILFREHKKEAAQAVTFTVNGHPYTLGTNELLELPLNSGSSGVIIYLNNASTDDCNTFVPEPGVTYYIACSMPEQSATASLTAVDKAMGEYSVKGIEFAQKKKRKGK